MKASTAQKQLNIRSNEAFERAHRIAALRATSVTAVIETALQNYETSIRNLSQRLTPAKAAENRKTLDAALARMWGPDQEPGKLGSDHSWLYDDKGLPR